MKTHGVEKEMITLEHYYMGRDVEYKAELTGQLRSNAAIVVERANQLLALAVADGVKLVKNDRKSYTRSGWRPLAVNQATPGAAKVSNHITCEAIDIEDINRQLCGWCMIHQDALEKIGLWMEHPSATKTWCHWQTKAPKSGKRVFYPG